MEEITVGSLVIFLDNFKGKTIPDVGLVIAVISFDDLIGEELGKGITWYSVMFGDVDMVVSSEMVELLK